MIFRCMVCVLTVAGLVPAPGALAQKFPEKAVRIVVPFAAGGGTDIIARIMAQKLSDEWGRNVVVDNRPGGGTVIGSELVARSTPDGYTLLLTANPHSSNPALVAKLPYDTARDFSTVTMTAAAPLLLVVHPTLPVRTVQELIAHAKARPNLLTYASSGNGGPQHLAGELLKYMAGVAILHVPYKGSAPALTDLLGGQVQLAFTSLLAGLPHIKAGKLLALGLTSSKRLETNPEIPTVAEAGVPGFEYLTWYGVFAPGGTSGPLVAKIQQDMARVLASPDVKERLARDGVQAVGNKPDEFASFIKKEIEKATQLIRMAGIKPG
ncbi:MAG: tripartite tricarboxylate transporter substrate binding protein [Betaproteobacteria bacterium]|nr:tripartite tricarboxylate transporter substrate binding protein [Betaproteobacteria bacterium]MBI3056335.1 tripartite tricarboxylate transporter substrate binding protein [Betaproteobacteria bacterium]